MPATQRHAIAPNAARPALLMLALAAALRQLLPLAGRVGNHEPAAVQHADELPQFLDGDPSVILVTDEDLHNGCGNAGGVYALRVSPSLTGPLEELSEWFIPADTPAPVCSVHVFSSQGDLVFIGSYNAGLQVVDYSDPRNPAQVAYYIAPGTAAWGDDPDRFGQGRTEPDPAVPGIVVVKKNGD
jgi:hypothetical protein